MRNGDCERSMFLDDFLRSGNHEHRAFSRAEINQIVLRGRVGVTERTMRRKHEKKRPKLIKASCTRVKGQRWIGCRKRGTGHFDRKESTALSSVKIKICGGEKRGNHSRALYGGGDRDGAL